MKYLLDSPLEVPDSMSSLLFSFAIPTYLYLHFLWKKEEEEEEEVIESDDDTYVSIHMYKFFFEAATTIHTILSHNDKKHENIHMFLSNTYVCMYYLRSYISFVFPQEMKVKGG